MNPKNPKNAYLLIRMCIAYLVYICMRVCCLFGRLDN